MNERNQRSDRRVESRRPTTDDERHDRESESQRRRSISRRRILRATAGVGVGATASTLALGGSTTAAGQTEVERRCQNGDALAVGNDEGLVIANQWSTEDVDQCVFRNDDGSYGWEWTRGSTAACPEDCPNYPEVVIGTKPWSRNTDTSLFPAQLGDIDDLDVDLDIDNGASGEEWNLALEWWHMSEQPPRGSADPEHEIMLILEKSESHTKGESIEEGAITDSYGNVIDHWEHVTDRLDWSFHIFKLATNEVPNNVDLAAIVDYLQDYDDDPVGFPADFWMTGIEIGNETWDHTEGKTVVTEFNVRLDGDTATTGVSGEFTDEPIETLEPPSNLEGATHSETEITVSWDEPSVVGSGIDHYLVFVDGSQNQQVPAGTTSATISGLSSGTSYEITVTAVGEDGTESGESDAISVTTESEDGGSGGEPGDPPSFDGYSPEDTTEDGLANDFTGSGSTTATDVNVFFENVDNPAITDNAAYYDFTGNGQVSTADVIELFERI